MKRYSVSLFITGNTNQTTIEKSTHLSGWPSSRRPQINAGECGERNPPTLVVEIQLSTSRRRQQYGVEGLEKLNIELP